MNLNLQSFLEFPKILSEHNESEVRVERKLLEKNYTETKTGSYAVQLGSSTLILSKTNESPISGTYKKQIVDQLCQIEQQKKMYHQLVTKDALLGSKNTVNQIRGGDLGEGEHVVMHVRLSLIDQKLQKVLNLNQG